MAVLNLRTRLCGVAALTVVAAAGGGAWAAGLGVPQPPPVILPGPTTTTARPTTTSSTTTTTSTSTTTTTVAPNTGVSPDAGAPESAAAPNFAVPAWAAQIMANTPVTGPNNSGGLLLALRPFLDLGLPPLQVAIIGMGRFPVAGFASWRDDFLDARFGPDGTFHFHHGDDLVSACGTPLRSPTDGTLQIGSDPAGGNTVEVVQPDRTYFYLAHLSAWVSGQTSGQHVRTGQIIGFVGQTGAATGCHLHLEIHPLGGGPVDPKPFVDRWLADAVAGAPALLDEVRAARGLPPLHPPAATPRAAPVQPATSASGQETLLWASAANPAGGVLALAEADAAAAVGRVGLDALASDAELQAIQWTEDEIAVNALLRSTTPPALRPLLGMSTT